MCRVSVSAFQYVQSTLFSSLSVLLNVVKVPDVKQHYRDLNAVQVRSPVTSLVVKSSIA